MAPANLRIWKYFITEAMGACRRLIRGDMQNVFIAVAVVHTYYVLMNTIRGEIINSARCDC